MPSRLSREGPPLEVMLRRVAEAPADFLAEPRIGPAGEAHVAAVVADVLVSLGARPTAAELTRFEGRSPADRNALAVTLLLCWLLADPWFAAAPPALPALLGLLGDTGAELAAAAPVPSRKRIDDPDRREELVRVALAALGLRPAGESEAQAEDRLTSLSSVERARVLNAARAAELRARQIREALRRKAAEESADKWTRE